MTVGIDGGYVHAREGDNRKAGWFEVIAGRSVAEHVLDWFHLTMRITVMRQIAQGLTYEDEATLAGEVDAALESIKHHLWHGNVHDALERIGYTMMDIDIADDSTTRGKLAKAARELYAYVARNRAFIPN